MRNKSIIECMKTYKKRLFYIQNSYQKKCNYLFISVLTALHLNIDYNHRHEMRCNTDLQESIGPKQGIFLLFVRFYPS